MIELAALAAPKHRFAFSLERLHIGNKNNTRRINKVNNTAKFKHCVWLGDKGALGVTYWPNGSDDGEVPKSHRECPREQKCFFWRVSEIKIPKLYAALRDRANQAPKQSIFARFRRIPQWTGPESTAGPTATAWRDVRVFLRAPRPGITGKKAKFLPSNVYRR